MRIRINRVDSTFRQSPEMLYKFAVETMRSINAPYVDQCIELELMLIEDDDDGFVDNLG